MVRQNIECERGWKVKGKHKDNEGKATGDHPLQCEPQPIADMQVTIHNQCTTTAHCRYEGDQI